jgi:hypothetical protein
MEFTATDYWWSSPAQWFLVPSLTGLMTLFYCLTSLTNLARDSAKLLLAFASTVIFGSESLGTLDHILLPDGCGTFRSPSILSRVLVTIGGFGMVIGFIDHSQVVTRTKYNTLADSHITNHATLNLLSVLSLVFTVRFLATDLSQSHSNFNTLSLLGTVYHLRLPTPWIPICGPLSSDSVLDSSIFYTFHLLLTGHSTGIILTSR